MDKKSKYSIQEVDEISPYQFFTPVVFLRITTRSCRHPLSGCWQSQSAVEVLMNWELITWFYFYFRHWLISLVILYYRALVLPSLTRRDRFYQWFASWEIGQTASESPGNLLEILFPRPSILTTLESLGVGFNKMLDKCFWCTQIWRALDSVISKVFLVVN